jgi:hypothetical protein
MSRQLSVETTICTEYLRLLEASQAALEIWKETRAEVCQSRLIAKEAGDELLRLQANYARAYTMVRNHAHNCPRCQLLSRIGASDTENSSHGRVAR